MRQSINLLITLEKGSGIRLNARRLLEVTALFAVLLGFFYVATWWRTSDKRAELSTLSTQQEAKRAELEKLKSTRSQDKTEDQLKQKLETLTARQNAKLRVISVLTDKSVGNIHGFSGFMKGLAEKHVDGVWIRDFDIGQGGSSFIIQGSTIEADKIPELLQDLGTAKAFEGMTFEKFSLDRNKDDKNVIDFVLTSNDAAGTKK